MYLIIYIKQMFLVFIDENIVFVKEFDIAAWQDNFDTVPDMLTKVIIIS